MKTTAITRKIISKQINPNMLSFSQTIDIAIKDFYERFGEITEIGRFRPLKVTVKHPMKNSPIQKAFISVAPSVDKNDFRTRVLSFAAESPVEPEKKYCMTLAIGNKFSIDSALKNPKIKTAFKDFITTAERVFG